MQEKTPVQKQEPKPVAVAPATEVAPVIVTGESYWKVKPEITDFKRDAEKKFPTADVGLEYQVRGYMPDKAKPGMLIERPLDKDYMPEFLEGDAQGTAFVKMKGKGLFVGFKFGGSDNAGDDTKLKATIPQGPKRGPFER